jgi:hypothetical protein
MSRDRGKTGVHIQKRNVFECEVGLQGGNVMALMIGSSGEWGGWRMMRGRGGDEWVG